MVAHTALMRYRHDLNSLQPWAAGGGGTQALDKFQAQAASNQVTMPSWQDLFGSADACACKHCLSVLSPAAYLTDLLHFLADPPTGGDHPGWYDSLKVRRPDIPLIHLNCDNTETVLPYIDLVNEVLEHAVAGGGGNAQRQTTGRPEDLALHPEHLNGYAYTALSEAGLRHPGRCLST